MEPISEKVLLPSKWRLETAQPEISAATNGLHVQPSSQQPETLQSFPVTLDVNRRVTPAEHFQDVRFMSLTATSKIDYMHPALGGCFGEGCLVASGYDFVGDDYTGMNEEVPDDDPMDCGGHGTHVAGIIAAQMSENPFGMVGAAPGVELAAYKVFGCDGSVQNDVLIAAFNRAYEEGADVITSSVGASSSSGLSTYYGHLMAAPLRSQDITPKEFLLLAQYRTSSLLTIDLCPVS